MEAACGNPFGIRNGTAFSDYQKEQGSENKGNGEGVYHMEGDNSVTVVFVYSSEKSAEKGNTKVIEYSKLSFKSLVLDGMSIFILISRYK